MRRRSRVDAFLEAILKDRRPPRFPAEPDEARDMLTAAALRAGRPGADAPRPEFVDSLERRLRAEMQAPSPVHPAAPVSRRRLLGGAAAAVAAAVGAGVGIDRMLGQRGETGLAPQGQAGLVPATGSWMDVAAIADVPVGRPLRFSAGAIEGYLVNHGGSFQAISAICTHLPCTLRHDSGAQQLECPCHGATFGLDGTSVQTAGYPYSLPPLPTVRSRVVDGRLQVFSA
ncbi:MAG TPA: Rieske (2Fe-2S) protein [Candidatus Dormibacteraeota bacterium]|jgi:nitrite reductase/ring-hydroxylating ferredoxin subunit|nr:Rieske (2Fe-2S) protein [Candidatus Dormibacteraeota bacterium]